MHEGLRVEVGRTPDKRAYRKSGRAAGIEPTTFGLKGAYLRVRRLSFQWDAGVRDEFTVIVTATRPLLGRVASSYSMTLFPLSVRNLYLICI
jgi:hypothetical protein